MFKREMKINFKSYIIWTSVLIGLFLIVFLVYPSIINSENMEMIDEMIKIFPEEILKAFNMDISSIDTAFGWLKTEGFIFVLLITGIYSGILGSNILVKEEDAVRVNRIVERFKLTTVDQTKVETALEKTELENTSSGGKEKTEIAKEIQEKNTSEDLLNKLLKKQNIKEENENTNPSNIPNTEKEIQSESSLKMNAKMEGTKKEEKPSIREKLDTIKKENEEKEKLKAIEETKEIPKQEKMQETKHKQPKKKNRKKERSK